MLIFSKMISPSWNGISYMCYIFQTHNLRIHLFTQFYTSKNCYSDGLLKYKQTYISSAAITHLIHIYWSPYIIMKVLWGADCSNKSCTAGIAPRTIIKKGLPGQWTGSLPKWCLTSSHHHFNIETFLCCAHFFSLVCCFVKILLPYSFFHLSLLWLTMTLWF